jgi:endonuclease/exonuclease/phosphatase family metal-dependent hydrolase
MKLFAFLVVFGLIISPNVPICAETAVPGQESLCVMTYNLRYASPNPPNAWPQRRPLVLEVIRDAMPDVLGTQEGLYPQLKDLAAGLPEYEWIGLGRDGGSKGEFMAVFYRKSRLEPLAFDHFWLSDTPDVIGSTTWGNQNRRMVTWVKFRDRITGNEFHLFNTHFDHEIQLAREQSAKLVRQRIAALDSNLPILLIGDFNSPAGSGPAYKTLTDEGFFSDAWLKAKERRGADVGTFNEFKAAVPNGARIDWILTRGAVVVEEAETVTFTRDGQFPSDHYPVVARVRLPSAK